MHAYTPMHQPHAVRAVKERKHEILSSVLGLLEEGVITPHSGESARAPADALPPSLHTHTPPCTHTRTRA